MSGWCSRTSRCGRISTYSTRSVIRCAGPGRDAVKPVRPRPNCWSCSDSAPLRDRRPSELSGGEQQRVGLARALARDAASVSARRTDRAPGHPPAGGIRGRGAGPAARAWRRGRVRHPRRRRGAGHRRPGRAARCGITDPARIAGAGVRRAGRRGCRPAHRSGRRAHRDRLHPRGRTAHDRPRRRRDNRRRDCGLLRGSATGAAADGAAGVDVRRRAVARPGRGGLVPRCAHRLRGPLGLRIGAGAGARPAGTRGR